MTDRFDHLCDEPECCSYKQRTFAGSCRCHKTRETMMLEHIARLENASVDLYHRTLPATVIFDDREVPALETTR